MSLHYAIILAEATAQNIKTPFGCRALIAISDESVESRKTQLRTDEVPLPSDADIVKELVAEKAIETIPFKRFYTFLDEEHIQVRILDKGEEERHIIHGEEIHSDPFKRENIWLLQPIAL